MRILRGVREERDQAIEKTLEVIDPLQRGGSARGFVQDTTGAEGAGWT